MSFNNVSRLETVLELTNFSVKFTLVLKIVTQWSLIMDGFENYGRKFKGTLLLLASAPVIGSKAKLAKERDDERTHLFLISLDSAHYFHI